MGDTDPNGAPPQPADEIVLRLLRTQARIARQRGVALNEQIPLPVRDPATGQYIYQSEPVPLPRLLGSPLVQSGPSAIGPNGERLVTDGWNKPRNGYDGEVSSRRHGGLDFRASYREKVYAAADGKVRFAGYQRRVPGGTQAPTAYQASEKNGDLTIPGGTPSALAAHNLGHGGLYVSISHNGDFEGYITEYMHLSSMVVKAGDVVSEGQHIGYVGTTGGDRGTIATGTHLHFQVSFANRVAVNPTGLVPNRNTEAGSTDSLTSPKPMGLLATLLQRAPVGMQRALAKHAGAIAALDKGISILNQDRRDIYSQQALYFTRVRDGLTINASALYQAAGAFSGPPPVVDNPMTFDFTTGTWTDGKPV